MPGKGFKLLDAYVEVHGDADGAVKEAVGQVDNDGGRARMSGLQFGKRLVAGIIGSIIIAKIGSYLGDAVTAGSDLNETVNKSNVIFGKNAQVMRNWAENAATSMGLSQQAALASASGFGDMFSQIGFGSDAAAEMSKQVVQMSADLGSFNNLDTADVADRMSAAFRGEYDSLQALIPNINAARVEQEAMAATGKTNASELTAQEKAAAVLAIVMKDGAKAMGDFSNTADGWANQMKIARAQSDDLKASIGTSLKPGLEALAGVLTAQVMPGLQLLADKYLPSVAEWMQKVADKIGGLDLFNFNEGVITLGSSWDTLREKLAPIFDTVVTLAPLFFGLRDALAPLVPIIVDQLAPYLPEIASAFTIMLAALIPLIPQILELLPPLIRLVVEIVPPLAELIGRILPGAIDFLSGAIGDVAIPALTTLIDALNGGTDAATALDDYLNHKITYDEFMKKTTEAAGPVGFFQSAIEIAGRSVGSNIANMIEYAINFRNVTINKFNEVVWEVQQFPSRVYNALGNMGSILYSLGVQMMAGFVAGVASMAARIVEAVTAPIRAAVAAAQAALQINSPSKLTRDVLGRPMGEGIAVGLDLEQERVTNSMQQLVDLAPSLSISQNYPVGFGSMDTDKGKGGPTYVFEAGAIVLDARNVKDFTDIVDMLKDVPQVARAGAGTPTGK